jgi:high-affinity iron transporter
VKFLLRFAAFSLLGATSALAQDVLQAADEGNGWHRLVGILQYLESDYPAAAQSQSPSELEEQRALASEAASTILELGRPAEEFRPRMDSIRARIDRSADPAGVSRDCAELVEDLVRVGGLSRSPRRPPDLTKGEQLYAVGCAACHGADGSAASAISGELDPKPTSFLSSQRMEEISPYKAFTALTFGVTGTSMPSYSTLTEDDRWALAFFLFTLRQPPCDHQPPRASLERLAISSDPQLASQFGAKELACLRRNPPRMDEEHALLIARSGIENALRLAGQGKRTEARKQIVDAYLAGIEPVEPLLRGRDPGLVRELEQSFMRTRLAAEKDKPQLASEARRLLALIDRARRGPSQVNDFWSVFWLSLLVLVREGFEASVVIAALLAVLRKMQQREQERIVHLGWILAIALGAFAFLFGRKLLAGADRELLEAIVAMAAVVMLVYAALWLNRRATVRRFMGGIRHRMQGALGRGSALGLFTVAFTSMLRESFETAVFLQGLSIDSPAGAAWGALGGVGVLVALVIFVNRVGYRLPMKALFNASTVLLLVTAVVLLGKGLHALQALAVLPLAPVAFFELEALGIFPDLYSLLAQLALILAPLVWLLLQRPEPKEAEPTVDSDSTRLEAK